MSMDDGRTPKYIFITARVSSLGKGLAPRRSLPARGARLQGDDAEVHPYINVVIGTMSPYQHGECE